ALATALNYISSIGIEKIADYEDELLKYATEKMLNIPGMRIIGTANNKSSVISFLIDGIHPYDMGTLLDRMGVAIRTGHHCAEPLMKEPGVEGTARVSFAFYNTKEEIDTFVKGLVRIVSMFS